MLRFGRGRFLPVRLAIENFFQVRWVRRPLILNRSEPLVEGWPLCDGPRSLLLNAGPLDGRHRAVGDPREWTGEQEAEGELTLDGQGRRPSVPQLDDTCILLQCVGHYVCTKSQSACA